MPKETKKDKKNIKKQVVAKKTAQPKAATAKTVAKKITGGFSAPVFSLIGVETGQVQLPKEIFGVKIKPQLLALAARVYSTNSTAHFGHTKTRGEIRGTTKKMYKQKGTGNARHGAATAPIFVGGGVALGPKYRKTVLSLPKKMKKAALLMALSQKMKAGSVVMLAGVEKASGKTKEVAALVRKIDRGTMLVLVDKNGGNIGQAARNIQGLMVMGVDQVNAFEVLKYNSLVLTKEAVERLESRIVTREKENERTREREKEGKR